MTTEVLMDWVYNAAPSILTDIYMEQNERINNDVDEGEIALILFQSV
jgi:hypothetical protein